MAKTIDAGALALKLLAEQRLPSTPQNYHVAWLHVTDGSPAVTRMIRSIVDDGMRILQDQADEIYRHVTGREAPQVRVSTAAGGESGTLAETEARITRDEERIRHQLMRIADIATSSGRATSDFGRDLKQGLERIGPDDTGGLASIITTMIERAARAEEDLAATNDQLNQMRQELETARGDANRDALTGLYNRRAFDRHLAETIGDKPRAIAVIDVDRFKSVNDRFGHGVGDRVLKQVATLLQKNCSEHFVARWGGEEFVICFYGLDAAQASALVDRARADMAAREMRLRESGQSLGQITFSAGVSDIAGHEAATADADRLLYLAKNDGRNQVRFERQRLAA